MNIFIGVIGLLLSVLAFACADRFTQNKIKKLTEEGGDFGWWLSAYAIVACLLSEIMQLAVKIAMA
ncbi:hypothetical protein [Caudoviricetes sp.]|nr:hypothetical protein [Caudoviricetes sp.]